ncbi:MAG: bifunctional adenosylcobinamide kinase/adenosylcobinamide-phosphate guanylyltransferase [Acidimicrobiales bacterium]
MALTLVLGGARSGKSAEAERLAAAAAGPVTYLATGDATDDDMAARIAAHQHRRPVEWTTVEVGRDLVGALGSIDGTVLVDSLGSWLAGHEGFAADADAVAAALVARTGDTVVVSEEVGWGVHPSSEAGRAFRDALGALNQAVAAVADVVLLVVAGRVLRLEDGR